ncbi:MAG TPA: hypothetical protein VN726_22845 [Hanamia sp.]|nr:hypothetical protein [Hanamia sp.]
MYRVISNITIVQQPRSGMVRNKTLIFDFVHEFSCSDNWRDLTNKGKVTVPKNLYVRDANNQLVPLFGTNVNIGGFSSNPPLLMRGDQVTIDWGYKFFKNGKEIFQGTKSNNGSLFQGWISEVTSKKPMEFLVEDNMWKLKQIQAPLHTFSATDTLENILSYLLKNTPYTVNALTSTTFGAFRVGNETVAEVLARLRKQFHFESYFRGNELRCGSTIYIESEANTSTFTFQQNIISDELEYRRKDDIVLSIVASNKIEEETGKLTKDGHNKTKCTRLEVLVTLQNGSDVPTTFVKTKGQDYPPNTGGERMTLPYPGATSIAQLVSLATAELKKFYYTGFKGKFTTFGLPYVRMGDNVQLMDNVLPERNGLYKVRGVEYTGGVNGLRQTIELDYLILN